LEIPIGRKWPERIGLAIHRPFSSLTAATAAAAAASSGVEIAGDKYSNNRLIGIEMGVEFILRFKYAWIY